ncbi:MAG: 2-oxoglutarate dehydrogenase, E2 component, dihydrolipoamide succinyltransferase [Acidobacteriia bacterium]|nr:2-oxoglutarate dehydrogenase, E2 component, dihydrolipoamide succinyltransferase [Terriglobia bacterium]
MPTDVVMPQMGESIFEGTITKWLKKPGDKVSRDEPLFEISTDKVDAEIPSPTAGVLKEIKVPEGTTVQVNTVVGTIAAEGEAAGAPAAAPQPQAAAPATAKPEAAQRAPEPAKTAAKTTAGEEQEDESTVLQFPHGQGEEGERIRSSPLVRRIARENSIDLNQVQGTGLGGRITKEDIVRFVEHPAQRPAASAPAYQPGSAAPAMPSQQPIAIPGEVMPMSAMRKKIAERMVQSKRTSAHVHSVFEVDLSRVMAIRQREKASFEQRTGTRLTMMPFFCRAAIESIRNWPIVNASVEGDNLHYHRNVNLGIAVALDWGLIVPVIKRAEELNFLGIQRAIIDLAERARSKKLLPDEVAGGTFTVTNPGSYGQMFGLPIIMQPQVAILGVGSIKKQPVVISDENAGDSIAIRSICHIILGYDHRVIDGAVGDQFLRDVARYLENWNEPLG